MTIEELLIEHEGFISHCYQDSLGYWTIGIGRLVDKSKGGGITKEEAVYLLKNDIEIVKAELDSGLPWWRDMPEKVQLVMMDMCFNLGLNGLMQFKNTLAAMREGRYTDAATAMKSSKWYTQVPNRVKDLIRILESED
jgi:lysozyme